MLEARRTKLYQDMKAPDTGTRSTNMVTFPLMNLNHQLRHDFKKAPINISRLIYV